MERLWAQNSRQRNGDAQIELYWLLLRFFLRSESQIIELNMGIFDGGCFNLKDIKFDLGGREKLATRFTNIR